MTWDFPGVPVLRIWTVKEGDMDLIPGGETETPHAAEKLSLCAVTAETCMLWSLWATTENLCATVQDPTWHDEDPRCHN